MYNIQRQFKKIILIPLLLITIQTISAQGLPENFIKRNITVIASPLKSLLQLEPRIFEYDTEKFKELNLKQGRQYGFLVDNIHNLFPGMVSTKVVSYMYGKNTYRNQTIKTINEVSLIPVLVASLQELHKEIEQLKSEIKELKK